MTHAPSTSVPTLQQRRARHAWEAVAALAKREPGGARRYGADARDYASAAKEFPMRVMSAGLGPALSYLLAKAKEKPVLRQLHDHLTDWVIKQRPMAASQPESLLQSIIHGDSNFLRRATDESLAYLEWLNRFAQAEGLVESPTGE